eukprot:CAMPEP_0169476924 /NCGR_PEP_ID=MMETSP1042-20121227/27636_1 /TAXON_ID=464988 /ORGANISM="Hemiselmis andersenii, Strain CCMP1180" /LENGTH=163 /DNA_ID=CAMNT_0009591227 /DNA_START=144 /DNA_END=632 /DNA_ORIENTATION=-
MVREEEDSQHGDLDGSSVQGHDDASLVGMLIESARIGSVKRVTQLLKAGCPVNAADDAGRTALHVATSSGQADVCLVLLSRGADPYQRDHRGQDCGGWAEEALVGKDLLSGHSKFRGASRRRRRARVAPRDRRGGAPQAHVDRGGGAQVPPALRLGGARQRQG